MSALLVIGAGACGGSAHVARGPTTHRGMHGLPGALLTAAGLPRGATLAVLVEQQHGSIVGFEPGRWPFRERNFGNVSVAYDLPATPARRAEAGVSELGAASAHG